MMKLKDIEKKLKHENDGRSVPDVYARASKAPLNKLLTGETPARAFQKRLVVILLSFVVLIFLTVAVGLSAIWLTPAKTTAEPKCYVSISIQREQAEEGEQTEISERIGVLMSGAKSLICIVSEMKDGVVNTAPLSSHSSRISEFISSKSNDKVFVELVCNDRTVANEVVKTIREELNLAYGNLDYNETYVINFASTKECLADYLEQCGVELESRESDALLKAYAKLFE